MSIHRSSDNVQTLSTILYEQKMKMLFPTFSHEQQGSDFTEKDLDRIYYGWFAGR